ncbi:MAG: crotonase/enoyl-CoA hydratase family protein [Shimia sp.]
MTDHVTTTIEGGLATVTLARPDKRNALTFDMFEALHAAGEALRGADIRAVILTGAGDDFCAGLDLGAMQAMAGAIDGVKAELADHGPLGTPYQRPVTVWATLPVPVIAAIRGHCLGAGAQLALGADLRIVAPDAKVALMEAKWGLVPDMGLTRTLPRLMRADLAKALIMSARVLSGVECHAMGLATEVADDPLARAHELAFALAQRSPEALAAAKRLVDEGWGGGAEGLRLEAELQSALIGSPNQVESVMVHLQKRAPSFG